MADRGIRKAHNSVYEALLSRLSSLGQKRDMLQEDIARPEYQAQPDLIDVLTKDLNQTEILLQKFMTEMEDFLARFGPPHALQISAATDVVDVATPATDAVNSEAFASDVAGSEGNIVHAPVIEAGSSPPNVIDTTSTHDPPPEITNETHASEERRALSLCKRLGQWLRKKINGMHLGRLG